MWSRRESDPRPLECHAKAEVYGRCATVRNRARNQALASVQAARRARSRTVRPAQYPHTIPAHSPLTIRSARRVGVEIRLEAGSPRRFRGRSNTPMPRTWMALPTTVRSPQADHHRRSGEKRMIRGEGTAVVRGVTPADVFYFVLDPAQYTKADTKIVWVTKLADTPDGMIA